MLDGRNSKWFRERGLPRFLSAIVVAFALLSEAQGNAAAQAGTLQHSASAVVQGTVRDAAGKPVSGALVRVEGDGRTSLETHTNAAGVFEFSTLAVGTYRLSAEKSGLRIGGAAAIVLSEGDRKHIDLVLGSSAGAVAGPMEFSDVPNFTVAGVTDWTAVGGHGSDSILRTSEDLARETMALKAQGGAPAGSAVDSSQSESRLRAALASAPGEFLPNHQLGAFYLEARRYRESLPLFEVAYQIEPTNEENERDLVVACENAGELQQAGEHMTNLLKRGNDADLHRMAGELDEKRGDPLAAVQQYQQAVALDPSEENYFAWGSELLLHRAVWQAAEVFRSGVNAHPKSARLLTALGTALFAGARYDEAARSLCAASDLDPANDEPYLFMGKIEMAAPTPLPCVAPKLAQFVQRNPDNSLANYFYAMALWKQQEHSADKAALEQVEALLTKAVSLDAKCSDGYLQLGILAAAQRNYEKAIQLYNKAIDADPQSGEAHYRLGVAYDHAGEREKAAREFQLHDEIDKRQAAAIEQERRDVKQFVVVQAAPGAPLSH
jgi:tetratricopeptide (TPR) repeat protein